MNIRTILIALSGMMCSLGATAEQRDKESMDLIAKTFFSTETAMRSRSSVGHPEDSQPVVLAKSSDYMTLHGGGESFYVYGFGNGEPGFVLVSADTDKPEVLGFSYTESFASEKSCPEVEYMLRSFASRQASQITPVASSSMTRAGGSTPNIAPLLGDIQFNQDEPYNNMGPKAYMGNCDEAVSFKMPTGCVATAAAQIMTYYKFPSQMKGMTISYTSDTNRIPITWDCKNTTFNWDNILPSYTACVQEYDEDVVWGENLPVVTMAFDNNNPVEVEVYMYGIGSRYSYKSQLWIAKENGELICPAGALWGWSIDEKTIFIRGYKHYLPVNIPDGTYHIRLCIQILGTDGCWHLCTRPADRLDMQDFVAVQKTGSKYKINDIVFDCIGVYTTAQANEVAKLNSAIGASIHMDYDPSASGAFSGRLCSSIVDYFGYDSDVRMVSRSSLNDTKLHDCLQCELAASRPVYLAGGQHAFVLDGCQGMNGLSYYHINWGWGGSYNGYYLIDYLTPEGSGIGGNSSGQYSKNLELIIGIQPENGVRDVYNVD